jgi:hypothetical protein
MLEIKPVKFNERETEIPKAKTQAAILPQPITIKP